jgi:hypothetical protein
VNEIGYIWFAVEVVALIDAFRHPSADWAFADRDRFFWVAFIFFFGPLFAVPYLLIVRPRFPGEEDTKAADAFRKQ